MGFTLWLFNIGMENPLSMVVLMGTSSIKWAIFHSYVKSPEGTERCFYVEHVMMGILYSLNFIYYDIHLNNHLGVGISWISVGIDLQRIGIDWEWDVSDVIF